MDLYNRMKAGEPIRADDPEHQKLSDGYERVLRLTAAINTGYSGNSEVRRILSELTCSEISEDTVIIAPFYSDWG